MAFKLKPDTPTRTLPDGIVIVSGPGGCPWVTDPERPHLGGNFDGGDLGTMYQDDLWPWLIDAFDVKTIADVGCGTGETLRWFLGRGCTGFGVDGLPWNVERARQRAGEILLHDFQDGPCAFPPVDLIWCADVAEHVEEQFVPNLLQTLRQCRVLAMCQGTDENADMGWHHVNNQPEEYWVAKLAAAGMVEDAEATRRAREIGNHGGWAGTGRIYRRRGK